MARKKLQPVTESAPLQNTKPWRDKPAPTERGSKRRKARREAAAGIHAGTVRLLDYQRRWVEDDSALKIVVKGRQIGYSFSATLRALLRCLDRKTTWIFLSKGERQSRLLMEKVHEHIHSCGIIADVYESTFFEGTSLKQLEVRFPNGSVIYGLPSNPDTARGYSGNVTLDEFAFHAEADKIYAALFPTITRGYSLEVISTPNGQQGKFYELAKAAGLIEQGLGVGGDPKSEISNLRMPNHQPSIVKPQSLVSWSAHWCDIYEAIRQGLKINIELLRSGCDDEATWQQEFCCQFVSTAENFFPPELLAACLSAEARADASPLLLASARGASDGEFFLGIDIGRQHDRTVFWLDELQIVGAGFQPALSPGGEDTAPTVVRPSGAGMKPAPTETRLAITRMVRTLDRAPFAEQLAFARELLLLEREDGTPLVRRAAIDATGIGAMLAETLAAEFTPRVEPVTFTAARKEELAFRTKRRMENQMSFLPDTREVRRAFSAVKKLVTPSGNLRFDAVRTASGHADEFWAKALADHAAAEAKPRPSAADAYLATGTPIVNPRAFMEFEGGWETLL
ncbi:MAG TPA: terminase family protein [Terriglobia bacterium]|nr:terminase family protein [Terriglobia bacterium]